MKKIIISFLILLSLIFVACGKESGIGEFIDKEKIELMIKIRNELRKNGKYNKDILLDLYEKDKKFLKEYLEKI